MVQGIKDLASSLLWVGFDLWSQNFCMQQVLQKRKNKQNTTLKIVIKSQEKRTKEERKKKRPKITNPKQLRKWQ